MVFCESAWGRDIFFSVRLGSYIALELAVGVLVVGSVIGGTVAVVSAVAPRPAALGEAAVPPRALATAVPVTPDPSRPAPPAAATTRGAEPELVAVPRADGSGARAAAARAEPASPRPERDAEPLRATITRPSDPAAIEPPVARGAHPSNVYGAPDEQLLAPLRDSPVVGCKANYGGTSLSLRLDFQSGGRAAFKPDQVHAQSQPRREVAAYRVDRLLGIGRVPPAAAISVSLEEMLASIGPSIRAELSKRIRTEAIPRKGQLRGAASWWIPQIKVAAIGKHPIDSTNGIVTWKRYLAAGATRPPEVEEIVAQISDMVLFDFLIDNSDRWSGGNARTSMDGRTLYFMDNTLAFTRNKQAHTRTNTYLRRVQVFSKRLVERVRGFTRDELVAALTNPEDEVLAPLLNDAEIDAILARRDAAVAYLDELLAQHPPEQVLAFP